MGKAVRVAILVVDDDSVARRFAAGTLRRIGCAVVEAATAADALTAVRIHSDRIDLAVIEAMMPHASGLDLAAELSRLQPGLRILYTSRSPDNLASRSIAQQWPEAVLAKPFTSVALAERVRFLLGGTVV